MYTEELARLLFDNYKKANDIQSCIEKVNVDK